MINAVAKYFKDEINALQRDKDVDVMSTHHYHTIFVYQDMVVKNLVNGYAKILAKQNAARGIPTSMTGTFIGNHIETIRNQAVIAYNAFYLVPSQLVTYYPKQGATYKHHSIGGMDFKLVIPPGAFRDRKDKSSPGTKGNVPYINQMFAGVYADAVVSMGAKISAKLGGPGLTVTNEEARSNNPRNITHSRVRRKGSPKKNLQTTATYGAARSFAGINEAGEFQEGEDIDTRIKADKNVTRHAKIVGDNTAVQVIDMFKNAINTEFKLTDIKHTELVELNRNIEIELEYADAAHNKMMEEDDKSGMIRFIKQYEKKLLKKRSLDNLARRFGVSAAEMQGSSSFVQKVDKVTPHMIIQNMFTHKSSPDMRLKVNKKLVIDAKSELGKETNVARNQKPSKTKKQGKKRLSKARVMASGLPRGKATSKVQATVGQNPMALRNLINAQLGQAVAKNMTAPALRFRTGRLANSVRVDNITQGPRGGNTMIETSYATDPYGTFAPGGKKYTFQRNPERLIKKSVREVATGLLGLKFGVQVSR